MMMSAKQNLKMTLIEKWCIDGKRKREEREEREEKKKRRECERVALKIFLIVFCF